MTFPLRRVLLQAGGVWLAIAVFAIANGTLRQAVLVPWLGDGVAPVLSVLILGAIIAAIEWRMAHRTWSRLGWKALLGIGAGWALGTVLFEFGLGRLVLGMGWDELLAQYDVLHGNLWALIPLLMIVGMPLMRTWRHSP